MRSASELGLRGRAGEHSARHAAAYEPAEDPLEELAEVSRGGLDRAPEGTAARAEVLSAVQRLAGNKASVELLQRWGADGERQPTDRGPASLRILDGLRVQRAVTTWGGEWDTIKYRTKKIGGVPVGVTIAIEFTPNDKVDAKRIGIVQGVVSSDLGAPIALAKETGARSTTKGSLKGFHIDQLPGFINPLYPTKAGKAGESLGSTPVLGMSKAGGGRHGFRFTEKDGTIKARSAQMNDEPVLGGHGANASQIFETTAIAVSGAQTGTYYGSVRWGWRSNAAGKFSRLPFSKLSNDVPTTTFAAAAGLWNKTKTGAGAAHIRLPIALGRFASADGSALVSNPKDAAGSELAKLDKNTRVELTSMGAGKSFNTGKDKWRQVTVVDGTHIGSVGWTLEANLATNKVK